MSGFCFNVQLQGTPLSGTAKPSVRHLVAITTHLSGSQVTHSFTPLMTTHSESSCALQGPGQAAGHGDTHHTTTPPSPLQQEPAVGLDRS